MGSDAALEPQVSQCLPCPVMMYSPVADALFSVAGSSAQPRRRTQRAGQSTVVQQRLGLQSPARASRLRLAAPNLLRLRFGPSPNRHLVEAFLQSTCKLLETRCPLVDVCLAGVASLAC